MQLVPSGHDQEPFQGVHQHDGEVDKQGEKEGERDISDHDRDIAKRRREAQEDEEGSCRSREYRGDRRGDGELFSGGAINPAGPSHAGLRPLTR